MSSNRLQSPIQVRRNIAYAKRSQTIDPDSNEEKLRIVILGATKVGKTCICQQFLCQQFIEEHKETLDELHTIEFELTNRHLTLEILDTAGIDEFPVMRRIAIAGGDAYVIVYSIDNQSSFDIVRQMRDLIIEVKGHSDFPLIIVGNKSDKEDSRVVCREYAETIATVDWGNAFIEASAYNRNSVLSVFRELLKTAKIDITFSPKTLRRSSDPALSHDKERTNKRQSCAQQ
ncbi:unnamed protein product [Didymodactylos carnosus]|uniref:GTP-binding protein Rhes n=1 Tax=Didymodactylos carnosus TaxID=1234261 RepID=A0A813VBS1_9BILA|nr:unnamed protein product [Didymodactylos carnosus]CAF0835440.1 unnamed protein product [Didymodactylos carnosus]CAF3571223.1 unnamed protein product [Didymodactylos carnosus]CAF3622661.1 unnamed protein product [Didymodactylos carnosus]